MVRVKSLSDPLPLNLDGVPDWSLLVKYIRSLGASPGFCKYQDSLLKECWRCISSQQSFLVQLFELVGLQIVFKCLTSILIIHFLTQCIFKEPLAQTLIR